MKFNFKEEKSETMSQWMIKESEEYYRRMGTINSYYPKQKVKKPAGMGKKNQEKKVWR